VTYISSLDTPTIAQTRPIYSDNSSNILYPILAPSTDISIDSSKRSTAMISRQNQSVDNTNITPPPPVPPRPNKDLIRERLLHTDVKENLIGIESIDEKKENRYINFLTYSHIYIILLFSVPLNSGKPDVCEISIKNQRVIPVR